MQSESWWNYKKIFSDKCAMQDFFLDHSYKESKREASSYLKRQTAVAIRTISKESNHNPLCPGANLLYQNKGF